MKKKIIIVLMGFPGSGKTTIANKLQNMFAKKNYNSFILDGDIIRIILNNFKYDYKNRVQLAENYLKISKKLLKQFDVIILSSIMLYKELENKLTTSKNIFPFIILKKFKSNKKIEIKKKYLKDIKDFYLSKKITQIENSNIDLICKKIFKSIKIKM